MGLIGELVVTAALAAGLCGAAWCLVRLPRVWRGETLGWLPLDTLWGPRVEYRSYPVFTFWLVGFGVGACLLVAGSWLDATVLAVVGVLLVLVAMFVLFPLWLVVNASTRPRFLVPPARRSEQGWWSRSRARQSSSSARTDQQEVHHVEILDVRPVPGDEPNQFEPYFVARCSLDGCGWTSDIVDASAAGAQEQVRNEAGRHSTSVAGPLRPLG